jgi:hypothetical protein
LYLVAWLFLFMDAFGIGTQGVLPHVPRNLVLRFGRKNWMGTRRVIAGTLDYFGAPVGKPSSSGNVN